MVETEGEASAMYEALMAIKPAGLSLNRWAQAAGINRSIFNGIKAHGNPTSATLQKLLDAIGVSLSDLYARMPPADDDRRDIPVNPLVRTEVKATGLSAHDVERAWLGPERQKPVPLLGTAFGGEWSDGVELTELHLNDVIDQIARPDVVAHDPHAYAVEIVGESMKPRYEPGERVIVSPRAAVHAGHDVIVQLTNEPGSNDDSDQLAGRVALVLIKRLVRQTSAFVELEQFNPPERFQVARERVVHIHRVRVRL